MIKALFGAALIVNTVRTRCAAFAAADEIHTSPINTFCPYAIPTEEEALTRGGDSSIIGNTVTVGNFNFGRTGNRFLELSKTLRLGYCCKSKLVSLPPKENEIAPDIFNRGNPGPRWFDFTSAPDVAGFNASTCPPNLAWGGGDALYLTGVDDKDHPDYTPGLKQCVANMPWIVGCEATYFLPADVNVCDWDDLGYHDPREQRDISPTVSVSGKDTTGERPVDIGSKNLVVHVRSGDVFSAKVHPNYGQPPLQFYIQLINEYNWSRVDFVTNGVEDEEHKINPVIPALESRVSDGELLGDIFFHKDRSFGEDLVSMLCADNLATAVSSISWLTAYHTSASRIFFPKSCASDRTAKRIHRDRPDIEVYGTLFKGIDYRPYHGWNNTVEQVTQMMEEDVDGFEQCVVGA